MGLTDPREPAAVHSCHPAGQRAGADRTRPDFSGGKAGLVVGTFVFVVQWLSYVQLCDPMNCSTAGFPVLHSLPEFAQIHVH